MRLNLQQKFLLPTLLVIITGMCSTIFISYLASKRALETSIHQQMTQLADVTAMNIESWLERSRTDIELWSESQLYRSALQGDSTALAPANRQLAALQDSYQSYEALCIADTTGHIISASLPHLIQRIDVSDRDYYQKALQGLLFTSGVMVNRDTGNPVFTIAAPIKEGDAIIGVIFGVISTGHLSQQYVEHLKIGQHGYAYVFDTQGMVIAYPDQSQIMELDLSEFDFARQMLSQERGSLNYPWNGREKLSAFQRIPSAGWTVVVASESQDILAPIRRIGALNLVMSLLALILAASIIIRLVRSIVQPISRSVTFAEAIAGGDLTATLDITRQDEIGHLAIALQSMRSKIQDVLNEIHSLTKAIQEGKLGERGDIELYQGGWRQLVDGINHVADVFQHPFSVTAEHLHQIAQGNIPELIEDSYQGDFDDVRQNLNRCISAISGLSAETKTLVQAATQGRLDERGDAKKFGGEYAAIVEGFNETIKTLVGHLNRIPVPITIIDTEFTLLFINNAGADMLGASQEQLLGDKCYEHFKSPNCRSARCVCTRAMQSTRNAHDDTTIMPRGRQYSVSYSSAPLLSQDGKAIGALGILMDQTEIKEALITVEQQNWMRSGQAELSEVMRGEQDVTTLAKHIISYLARYFQAEIGAIYLVQGTHGDNALRLAGSHAYTRRKSGEETITPGQGLVGQAALERESIIYSEVLEDYLAIKTGEGYETPQQILITPFFHEEQVKGVIEIGTRGSFTKAHVDFLQQASESIAVAFHSAETRVKMQELLEHSQQQAEELQAQTEELQVQTEKLQAQNEHQSY